MRSLRARSFSALPDFGKAMLLRLGKLGKIEILVIPSHVFTPSRLPV